MKKIIVLIIIPYLLILAAIFYFFFGPGIFSNYEKFNWKDLTLNIPKNFETSFFTREGWESFYLKKMTMSIQISIKSPKIEMSGLTKNIPPKKLMYQELTGNKSIYYLINHQKKYELSYAQNTVEATIFFRIISSSVYSAVYVMKRITEDCSYQNEKIPPPEISLPLSSYLTDFIFLAGMTIPLIVVILIFSISGRKPALKFFEGDPIICEESYASISRIQGYRRKNTFCYIALTSTRFMVFIFRKPVLEIKPSQGDINIQIEGKKIMIQQPKEKIVLRTSDIEKWKNHLTAYLS